MILKRLYELAVRERLLDDLAFESVPVPYIVKVGGEGEYLGIEERRGEITRPTKKGHPKIEPDRGKELLIAKPHGAPANAGFARYFADTLARVLPVSDEGKSVNSRKTFWQQMTKAAADSGDSALKAVASFGVAISTDGDLARKIKTDLDALTPDPGDRCTFAWHPDQGVTILDREPVRAWWRLFYAKFDQQRQEDGPQGVCQITGEYGPLATTHPRLPTIPGGMASGVSVVSNDKDAFLSYGLDAAANASIGYRAAEGYTRALASLIQQKLHRSRVGIGNALFLFWTRDKCDLDDVFACIDGTDPALVAKLLDSMKEGHQSTVLDHNAFYCLSLSGNSARVVVRDYLEAPLGEVRSNLAAWFADLRIVDPWGKETVSVFPLWQLAISTALDSDAVSPNLPSQLMDAALKRLALPDNVLAACVRRLAAEGDGGFRATRLALIKLVLNRKGFEMSDALNEACVMPAYVCGRLMAVFERLQWGALGDVNANVVDRFYGTASTSPGLVFPRLFKSAQQHLGKLQSDKPGMAVNLQKDIESLCLRIKTFPSLLALSEQGQFALGFYHQRAAYRKGKGGGEKE